MKDRVSRFSLKDRHQASMQAFHMSWIALFLCFCGWFAMAPVIPVLRQEFSLSQGQVGFLLLAPVLMTIPARVLVGRICDRYGPVTTYTWFLVLFSLPLMATALAWDFYSLMFLRLLGGGIGAGFVITQYHCMKLFSPLSVGTAMATSAGWGNMGGGMIQLLIPLVLAGMATLGISESISWRLTFLLLGTFVFIFGLMYGKVAGNSLTGGSEIAASQKAARLSWRKVAGNFRVRELFICYGLCFGVEITVNNYLLMYFRDDFGLTLSEAGMLVALFGAMNIFARTLGGSLSDYLGQVSGNLGRFHLLCLLLITEGVCLVLFGVADLLPVSIILMVTVSILVQMSEGATFALVPFVVPGAGGSVGGLVAAGGNVGALLLGLAFSAGGQSLASNFVYAGMLVSGVSLLIYIRFFLQRRALLREDYRPDPVHQYL